MAHGASRHRFGRPQTALILCGLLAAGTAQGQSLDYSSLQGLFDEPVTTSATGKPERISNTAATMDVITADDIKRSGARNLTTLLRLLPGIISYRGYNGTEAFSMGAILLNGREIYLGAFDETFLSSVQVELEEIRQIEVVHGPQSALYGFNASAGVINIITFDPARDAVDDVRGRVGNDALREGQASLTVNPFDGVGLRVTAAGSHVETTGLQAPPPMMIPSKPNDRTNFSANLSAYLPDGSHGTFEVAHSDVSLGTQIPEATILLNARLQNDAVKGDYTIDTAIGRIGTLLSYTSLTVPGAQTFLNSNISWHDHTVDGRLYDLVKLSSDDSVRLEFEGREEDVHTGASIAPISTLLTAGSAMWDHRFSDTLSMVNAVRYYHVSIDQTGANLVGGDFHTRPHAIADNSALIYRIDEDDTLRGSFARGISLPSQLSFAQLGLTSSTPRNQSLSAQPPLMTSTNTETRITYDRQLRDWGASARISLFTEQSDNVLSLVPFQLLQTASPQCRPVTPASARYCTSLTSATALPGSAAGAEMEIEHKSLDGLAWGANYSVERLRPHATVVATSIDPDIGETELLHKVNVHLGYGWGDWDADVRLLYTSPTPALLLNTLSGTPKVDIANGQATVIVSPRIGWKAADWLQLELAADRLWPYRLNGSTKVDDLYFLTATFSY